MIIMVNARALELGYTQYLKYSENTKIIVHINIGVSQRLLMYITSLINIAFNIMNMKNQDMLKTINEKACKYK